MTTALHKAVKRRTDTLVRDGGPARALIVAIYPGGYFGLRLARRRREETIDFASVYSLAVKQRVAQERAEKLAARKAAKASRRRS
jgi:hypothetical protein